MPEGTHSPNDDVRPWDSLSDDEKRLFARMAEVFAGFSEYTDHQVGRIIDYLEESGQLDNTIVLYCADNGASGEGSPNGSVNENKFFNGWPDDMEENLKHLDDLGSPNTYNHYPTGWAAAFSTPFKMFKRYSYAGGTCDPLVIHWPKGIEAKGEVRHQYHHVTDIVPTILDCCGLEFPDVVDGVRAGAARRATSMRYTFDAADAPTPRSASTTACSARAACGRRAGRRSPCTARPRASATSTRTSGSSTTSTRTAPRRTTSRPSTPTSSRQLIEVWFEEADKYDVLPLDDRHPCRDHHRRAAAGASPTATRTSTTRAPPRCRRRRRVNIRGRSYKILAEVEITSPDAEGVIFAHGSRFGGHALFLKDRGLHYVYNFLGIPPEQLFSPRSSSPGATCSAWSSPRRRAASTASRRARRGCTSTTTSWPRVRCARSPATSRCAATASASAATRATR